MALLPSSTVSLLFSLPQSEDPTVLQYGCSKLAQRFLELSVHRYKLPAKQTFSEARPAGFEPATRGLEVRIGTFATVRQGSQMPINEPNPNYDLSPMFADVHLGCRQNCRQL